MHHVKYQQEANNMYMHPLHPSSTAIYQAPSLLRSWCNSHRLVALGVPVVDKVALVGGSASLAARVVVTTALGPLGSGTGAGSGGDSRSGTGGGHDSTLGRSSEGGRGGGRLDGGNAAAAARGARVGGGGACDRKC